MPEAPAAPPPAAPTPGAPPPALSSAFDNLEKLGSQRSADPTTIPKHPSQKKAEPETPGPKPPTEQKPPEEVPPRPEEVPANEDTPKPAETPPAPKPKKPADFLRDELTRAKTERDQFKAEIEKLKAPKEDPEKKTLTEQLESERKRREELETEMRFTNYERSPEYKEKFEKPYQDAWNNGRAWVSKLKVTDADGNTRTATAADFDSLMELSFSDPDRAAGMVGDLFGNKASSVTPYMTRVQEAAQAANQAIDTYRKEGSEREKHMTETRSKLHKDVSEQWTEHKKPDSIPDKWKPFLTPKEGDDEGNKLLEAGYAKFDEAMGLDARNPRLTKEQRAEILGKTAAQRHLAANGMRLIKQVQARDSKIAELEAELTKFKESEPGGGDGKPDGEHKGPPADTMAGALGALDKKAKPQFY